MVLNVGDSIVNLHSAALRLHIHANFRFGNFRYQLLFEGYSVIVISHFSGFAPVLEIKVSSHRSPW